MLPDSGLGGVDRSGVDHLPDSAGFPGADVLKEQLVDELHQLVQAGLDQPLTWDGADARPPSRAWSRARRDDDPGGASVADSVGSATVLADAIGAVLSGGPPGSDGRFSGAIAVVAVVDVLRDVLLGKAGMTC